MLSILYQGVAFAEVPKPAQLFKELGNISIKIKGVFDIAKSIFGVSNVTMLVGQGVSVYKFLIFSDVNKKYHIGSLVYIPDEKRLDVLEAQESIVLLQLKGKQVAYRGFSELLMKMGLEKLFNRFVGTL